MRKFRDISCVVIDTSVLRGAGTSDHPSSTNNRKVLTEIYNTKKALVWCKELMDEYNKHGSLFSVEWLGYMFSSRQQIKENISNQFEDMVNQLPERESTGKSEYALTSNDKKAIKKDAHLVELALLTDKVVISNDQKAKIILDKIIKNDTTIMKNYSIRHLCWVIVTENLAKLIKDGQYLPESAIIK